ncbi:DUF488 family protein [Bdellovibrio bacteriovorus]|uniref:DUF488 domain-containing protein n=1 Tax=Bdellovibrio bacteriovorus TaxID=959 RepID=A0A150WU02_BDEBC|nr:DUF488 domain-containing protein [Bdellovibrio bacteriovorus]KYG69997.1 hypothetical protein AZI85_14990 [Bdellovibrio bacteriovorus]
MKIFTVGYEGCDIDEFTEGLKEKGVTHVVDIRKNPLSRKRGFSKKKLAEELAKKEIAYTHMPGLGVPTLWRKQAKTHLITREKMFRDYVKKVLPKQQEEILELLKLGKKKGLTLLCYESDASDCHRRYVAEEMDRHQKGKLKVENLVLKDQEGIFLFNIGKRGRASSA